MAGKKKGRFLSRLLLTYLVVALIPFSCITGFLFYLKWEGGKREMQRTLEYTAELLNVQLEAIWNTMSFISLDIVSNKQFIPSATGLVYPGASLYEKSNFYSTLVNTVSSYSYISSSYRIVFFNEEGFYLTNEDYNQKYNHAYRLPDGFMEHYEWTETAKANYGEGFLLPVSDSALPNVDTEGLTLVRSVRNPGNVVGFLAVSLFGENLSQLLRVGELYEIEIMILRDKTVLYRSLSFPYSEDTMEDPQALEDSLGNHYLVASDYRNDSKIKVIAVLSKEDVFQKNREDLLFTALVWVAVILVTLFLIFIFTRKMSKPLVLVTRLMQDTTVQNLNEDKTEIDKLPFREIQVLYSEFYKMKQRLNVMIDKEIAIMTLQSRERLSYLQSQINPHFLYNTLNMIGIMGMDIGDERIYNSCQMLAKVLKYAITEKESTFASFEEEFKNTEDYLKLMKLRFEDRLSFTVTCDDELKPVRTLRIILQPFVENIFEHGMDAAHTALKVAVKGQMLRDGFWRVTIKDNGAGMEEKALSEMKEEISAAMNEALTIDAAFAGNTVAESVSVGIKNTLIRLSLFYGKNFHYTIGNEAMGGFHVILEGKEGGDIEGWPDGYYEGSYRRR